MSRSTLSILLLALFLPACAQDDRVSPFEPQVSLGQGAEVLKLDIRSPFNNSVPANCLGENLHFTGTLVANGYIVNTPTGRSLQHMLGVDLEGVRVVGVTSGTEWTGTRFVLRSAMHYADGTRILRLGMEHDFFENEAGDLLRASNHITVVLNANGELVSFRWDIVDCKLFPAK